MIELRRGERLDAMTVLVEARPGVDEGAWPACNGDLVHHIKNLVGVTVDVRTLAPGSLERSVGKAKRVIDLRG